MDLGKYHSGAALLRNFFVDYRGGASTRAGTEYILQAFRSSTPVRLISFQASFTVSYVLEFGQNYIRFFSNGAAVLETAKAITAGGVTQANPALVNLTAHGYSVGDWVFITSVVGMTQVNGRYFIVRTVPNANQFTLNDLFGNAVDSSAYTAYVSGGTVARVYTLSSPYLAADLAGLKFAGNVNTMILCHPSYPPYTLTLIAANSWTLAPTIFGSNVTAPAGLAAGTTAAGAMNYSYVVTAVDPNGQESAVSNIASSTVSNAAGNPTITINWGPVSGAESYNIYRAGPSSAAAMPAGSSFGFVANVTGVSYPDPFTSGIPVYPADFASTIPIVKNPFQGAGVASVTITNAGTYGGGVTLTVTFGAAPAGGVTATGQVVLVSESATNNSSSSLIVGDILVNSAYGIFITVNSIGGGGSFATGTMTVPGTVVTTTPANPLTFIAQRLFPALQPLLNINWHVLSVNLINAGAGYISPPAVTFSSGAAAGTAVLQATSTGNPSVPIFFDQRLVLGGPSNNPHQFNMSQPGAYFNFNISNPVQPDDAITGTLVAQKLNSIQSFTVMSAGLITLTDQQAWLINGGAAGAPPTPIELAANGQAYNGSSALPPIIANLDILYVQAKGSIVRDLTFNFYTNIYTGADISIISSHLFYGFTLTEWAYAEEPFKVVWAVRNDGDLLSLTFVKEQELIGWTHSDTNGFFKSIASVTETVTLSNGLTMAVDAVYVVVQRTVNGQTLQYIERMAERIFPYGVEDAWCVDAGLGSVPLIGPTAALTSGGTITASQTEIGAGVVFTISGDIWNTGDIGLVLRMAGGIVELTAFTDAAHMVGTITQELEELVAPANTWTIWVPNITFSGGEHLVGKTCTGLADGAVIPSFVMPATGIVTLAAPATKVTVGLSFLPQLKTLALDLGQPTVQGKRKKIVGVSARCQDTLGLEIGKTFDSSSLVPMDDLVVGNLGSQTNEVVTNRMVTGDAWQIIDQEWDVAGNYCIQQPQPFPASILGVIPDVTVGDS